MTTPHHAAGHFDVSMQPQPAPAAPDAGAAAAAGVTLARMLLDKHYLGDLQASAQGQMLSAMTATAGSAGYVAIEQVSGTLHGRAGSFVLQHSGTMNRGVAQLTVSVVPDSGSGELAGLAGSLAIRIDQGRHFYTFDYTLPA